MKQEDKTTIISYRIEQAQIALDDAIYLNAGGEAHKALLIVVTMLTTLMKLEILM